MLKKMFSLKYLVFVLLTVVYCSADADVQSKDPESTRCYECAGAACERPLIAVCPPERPRCASVASAPNFTTSLSCAAIAETTCFLKYSTKQNLEMTCTCATQLCNAPFSRELLQELINFSSANIPNNRSDYTEMFWKQSHLMNGDNTQIYKTITVEIHKTTESSLGKNAERTIFKTRTSSKTQALQFSTTMSLPRAEALKLEATAPSDDDEDEGEGSGAEEEAQAPRRPAPPAAPSSLLPAGDRAAAAAPARPPPPAHLLPFAPLTLFIFAML